MTKSFRIFWSMLMALLMTHIPHLAWADAAANEMVPTSVVVDQLSREQARAKIISHINRVEVRTELAKQGIAPEEVTQRLASLSDLEMKRMATQMDQAMYGGEPVIYILLVVLLVVLIIYLVKRV